MRLPVDYAIITSHYGYRTNPITGQGQQFHDGIDFKSSINNLVYFPINCICSYDKDNYNDALRWSDPKESGGNCCIIDFKIGNTLFHMRFWHLIENYVTANQPYFAGFVVGKYGDVGESKGPHLHNDLYIQSVNKWEKINIENFYKELKLL
jgi:murein DD-endopeptidase MepM/ murein hydrolase activator NlpD